MQTLVDGFQHEQPDYWLNFGNPWEIERLNVGYSIKFYGHVSVQEEDGRQAFKWIPGDSVSLALAIWHVSVCQSHWPLQNCLCHRVHSLQQHQLNHFAECPSCLSAGQW